MRAPPPATAERILDVAERLVQTQGYNGFSYADISAALRITKASLHYHFPTKAKLGLSLVLRYHDAFRSALEAIQKSVPDPRQKLRAYVQLYADVLRKDRLCLCGMLAAEQLAGVLEEGRRSGTLHLEGPVVEEAQLLVAALEGAMLVARSYGDSKRFAAVAERVLAGILPPAPRLPKRVRQA